MASCRLKWEKTSAAGGGRHHAHRLTPHHQYLAQTASAELRIVPAPAGYSERGYRLQISHRGGQWRQVDKLFRTPQAAKTAACAALGKKRKGR